MLILFLSPFFFFKETPATVVWSIAPLPPRPLGMGEGVRGRGSCHMLRFYFFPLVISIHENTLVSQFHRRYGWSLTLTLQPQRVTFLPDVMCPSSRKDDGTDQDLYVMIKSLQCKTKGMKAENGEMITVTRPSQNLIYYFSYLSAMNTNFAPSHNHSIP